MSEFNTVAIMGRDSDAVGETLRALTTFLTAQKVDIVLDEIIAGLLADKPYRVSDRVTMGQSCDLVIVLGGDGSLLGAARLLAKHNVPVLGINRGRLGFLTDILPEELEQKVGAVLQGQYVLEKRFLLSATVVRNGEVIGRSEALNDVVVNSGTSAQMIEFNVYVDDEFVYPQRSDGLIVSTPTGSTAYSLSGGGPIMHPKLDAIVLVPMFPHTLSSRPIVIDGNSEIRIEINESNEIHPPVTCDGQVHLTAMPGDTVYITKQRDKLKLIQPTDHSFYASCRDKLGWGTGLIS